MPSAGYPDGPGEEDEKDLRSRHRQGRFDGGTKFGGVKGRTVTARERTWGPEWMHDIGEEETEMRVERPQTDEGIAQSAFDLNVMERPELLTAIPVKRGLAQEVCEELQKLCVSSAIRQHPNSPDFAIQIFELPVAGYKKEDGKKVKADEEVNLYSVPNRMEPDVVPPVFAALLTGPPEEVMEQSLLGRAKFSWSSCAELPTMRVDRKYDRPCKGAVRPRNVAVRYKTRHQLRGHDSYLDCWISTWTAGSGQGVPQSYLEVDLGANCDVTYVSTLGRFPPTDTYPSMQLQKWWIDRGVYTGPCGGYSKDSWTVVKPDAKGWEQWVTRYELQARLDGGKDWHTVSSFKGNSDMTTEVAHDLRDVCHNKDGLQCRYLRFIPQNYHNKPAMRIGVYGICSQRNKSEAKKRTEEEKVRYLIPVPLTNRNRRRHMRDGRDNRACSPEYRGRYGADYRIATRRKKLDEEVRLDAKEVFKNRKALLRRQDSAFYESDVSEAEGAQEGSANKSQEDASEEAGEPDSADPPQPTLARAVSQRVEEVLSEQPALQRTRTDDDRGYCSEPEELLADWVAVDNDWALL